MRKLLPLILLIAGLGIGVAYGHTFSADTVFNTSGGNITFAYNCTFDTYTYAGNQERFTNLEMNGNGTWTSLGFRNPDGNCSLNITHIGTDYIAMNTTLDLDGTTFEAWLPDDGEPDYITGDDGNSWASPTLDLIKTINGTVILEWAAAAVTPTGSGGGSGLLLILFLLMAFVLYMIGGRR